MRYPVMFIVLVILGFSLIAWGSPAFPQGDPGQKGGDCYTDSDNIHICQFESENSPACHSTKEFPNDGALAEFYGGRVVDFKALPTADGEMLLVSIIQIERPTYQRRYVFTGKRPYGVVEEPFDLCMTTILTKFRGEGA